ncbi:MAG: tetratricopeptide repeat protein [Gemmatimonadota bacterium]
MRRRIAAVLLFGLVHKAAVAQGAARLGDIEFPTSGRSEAQELFVDGVRYLHSFEYDSAAGRFRRAQRLDPGFALAYWGEAMTFNHPVWLQQDSAAARAVLQRLAPSPAERRARAPAEREKRWLDALEVLYASAGGSKERRDSLYAEVMRRFARDYPDDHEVQVFYALSLLGLAHRGRHVATYMKAAAVVENVFRVNPRHPGALHVLIHAYDDPVHAPLGLRAATAYSAVAPGAAHAQHMTSHIFVAMGMWVDVERANIAAWEATNRRNGHYTHWLSYGYLQMGRFRDSEVYVAAIAQDAARDPTPYKIGYRNLMLAGYLVDSEEWRGRWSQFAIDSVRQPTSAPNARQFTFALGLAAVARGDRARASAAIDSLRIAVEIGRRSGEWLPWIEPAEMMTEMLSSAVLATGGQLDSAVVMAGRAADREADLPFEFGPPEMIKPPFELLGELHLRAGRPVQARTAFERALDRTPNRTRSVLGAARAAAAMGETEAARAWYVRVLANLAHAAEGSAERREAELYLATPRP